MAALRIASLLLFLAAVPCPALAQDRSPNVVVIFADDLGYADLGCFGARGWTTPNLDRLANEGVRFTNFYAAQPVCSASRAGLLTGCYPNRIGIHGALGPGSRVGISSKETTIAELLKKRGYATAAIGKWHLGHHPEFLPTRHGFDQYFGLPYSNDMWPHHPEAKPGSYPALPLIDGETAIDANVSPETQATLTRRYTERAVQFIEKNGQKPFFLYVAHSFPHVPLFVGKPHAGTSAQGLYGDVIQEIDWSVGEILKAVKNAGCDEKTLVLFTSDNGPWLSYGNHAGSAGPLREGKGTVWEGGVRVPCVARWPGTIPAGTVQSEPAMTIDLLPTIAKFAAAELPEPPIDGRDIGPLLRGEKNAASPQHAYYFYYGTNELQAIRSGRWKLILPHKYRTMQGQDPGKDGKPGRYRMEQAGLELYDLSSDVGETKNVAETHAEIVQKLLIFAETARTDLGDTLTHRQGVGQREPGRVGDEPAKSRPVTIVLAGDSTVTDQAGWGKAFANGLKDGARCVNLSRGGRSSKSFRDEGSWKKVLAEKPDYVLIQFGHNDQPGKGPERETDPKTTYRDNLRRYVDEARDAGIKPILVTPLVRRVFSKEGKLRIDLDPYAEAVRAVAEEKKTPVVDLHRRSKELAEKLGPEQSKDFGPPHPTIADTRDNTHLSEKGAKAIAEQVHDELRKAVPELENVLPAANK